jgi:hypothetical protein
MAWSFEMEWSRSWGILLWMHRAGGKAGWGTVQEPSTDVVEVRKENFKKGESDDDDNNKLIWGY